MSDPKRARVMPAAPIVISPPKPLPQLAAQKLVATIPQLQPAAQTPVATPPPLQPAAQTPVATPPPLQPAAQENVAAASGAESDSPVCAAASGAESQTANESQSKQATLMISSSQPLRPKIPSNDEIISGMAGSVRQYAQNMKRYVEWKLSVFLYDDETVQLRQPLYKSVCPPIEDSAASGADTRWRPTSVMEALDMGHCISSLSNSEFYEGAVSIWNMDPFLTEAFEKELHVKDPSWPQFLVLLGHWSPANLAISHSDENKQRFFFPGLLMSFVKDVGVLSVMHTLHNMPVTCGHAVCWSFYAAIDEAFEMGDSRIIRLLWEVSNQVTVRLRLNPDAHQLLLDRLYMTDELRIKSLGAGVQSFFEMAIDLLALPGCDDLASTCPKLVMTMKKFGVTYKGKDIDKTLCYEPSSLRRCSVSRAGGTQGV